jgi:L-threonylcarbamoyladenylate synthase
MEKISNPTHNEIKRAAKSLKDGHLVAFPTETVYGLGADANNEKAVSRVYSTKGRPTDHPLIVHISSAQQLSHWARDIPDYAIKLAKEFWPGPMTLILKRSLLAKNYITGCQDSVGLRVPNHPIAQTLIREFEAQGGNGVVAPSANRFGAVSPTTADAVSEELGSYFHTNDLVLDGGQSMIGLESTIIDCTSDLPVQLRPGALTLAMITNSTGITVNLDYKGNTVKASGLMQSHYSPRARVILNSLPETGEGFIAMSSIPTPQGAIRLLAPETIEEFARQLYKALRIGDNLFLETIKVVEPNGAGLAESIRDRLAKSSARKGI